MSQKPTLRLCLSFTLTPLPHSQHRHQVCVRGGGVPWPSNSATPARCPTIFFFLRKGETSICCSMYLCIHRLLLVRAPMGIKPTTLAYWNNALTNWATQPGPDTILMLSTWRQHQMPQVKSSQSHETTLHFRRQSQVAGPRLPTTSDQFGYKSEVPMTSSPLDSIIC